MRTIASLTYATDPDTGKVYPVPAGGAPEGEGGNDDNDTEHDEGQEGNEPDEKDPRIKALSDEAARYRVRAKEATDRLGEVEAELQAARVELAVRREAATRDKPFADLDVVLPLVRESVALDDNGQPVEVSDALNYLADRHPYLLAENAAPTTTRTDPARHVPSGTSMNKPKQQAKGLDRKALEAKYPVLRNRGRR